MIRKNLLVFLLCIFVTIPVHAENNKWNEYKTTHFSIFYKDSPRDFVDTVGKTAEEYYNSIMRDLGFIRYKSWGWDKRAKIYVYNDKDDYIENARQYKWSAGTASVRSKTIRTFPAASGFFDTTLPHELGHIIFREFVGFNADIPMWFEEGVAMYQEKAKRWGSNSIVKKAIEDGTFMSLVEMSNMRLKETTPREVIYLYYAEAASIVYYLITDGGENYRFEWLCRNLKRGYSFEDSFKKAYVRFDNLEDLNRQWVDYLKR